MDFAGDRYYKFSRTLLTVLGLWPYYTNIQFRNIQRTFFILLLSFSICVQLGKILTSVHDLESFLQIVSFVIPCLVFCLKYSTFCIQAEAIKNIHAEIIYHWNTTKCKEELKILHQCSYFGYINTLLIATLFYSSLYMFLIMQISPKFLDLVTPLNESRQYELLAIATFFFDQEKYFAPIFMHMTVALSVEITIIVATETISLLCMQHACALFEIASFRIQHVFDCEIHISVTEKNTKYYTNIINAIIIHNRAIKFFEYLNDKFEISYFILLVLGVCSLSMNLFRVALAGFKEKMEELVGIGLLVICHFVYMFINNFVAQRITNCSADIFYKTCELPWYSVSIRNQKLLQFIMQRSMKSCKFTMLFFDASLERFASIRNVMDQVQRDWNILSNAQEIEIIQKYWAIGRFITLITTLFIYLSILGAVLMEVLSIFLLDITTTVNQTRSRRFPIKTEYFINQQKYFFPLLFHIFLFALGGLTTVAATETLSMSYAQHACGLYQIACFRIEKALHKNMIQGVTSSAERSLIICEGIISAVNMYRRADRFIEKIKTTFKLAYLLLLPLGVMSLSINLYRFSQLLMTDDYYDLVISILFIGGHFWYMFFCNYLGQEVIDHSGNIFYRTYNTRWYMAPLKAQKLLLCLMQRSTQHSAIVIGSLFVTSFEGFATLTSMSVSYFTVIFSVH
ncbi:uncharacterized protein [Anoplolepis gracilipes]|uniref:uncharacterized protein n=1 Tax=Anoplolepis gracilipes TaxID=354296 RepID=UPI003BA1E3E4